ncbi:hypothetical protein E1B28_011521 [Marasmius oreades]|uniref:Protein kinase domain-containing protein n=1 Tax=Marasmius oreades TaxID=181124 RepID=A0A9P7RUX0_9AGAR|nr:uncharacterized protein E1B28_011521 [Marasmius oreades]KAG7089887.1 hypothetical protein E1B28_011521 [Marasmius oreades]
MSLSKGLYVCVAISATVTAWYYPRWRDSKIRAQLPVDIDTWRFPGKNREAEERVWMVFAPVLARYGLVSWACFEHSIQHPPDGEYPRYNGYRHIPVFDAQRGGPLKAFQRWQYVNPVNRAVRSHDGQDFICRVIVVKGHGSNALQALRRLATGLNAFRSDNHVLPMLREIHFQDITCGLFPITGESMAESFGPDRTRYIQNSVGDLLDMFIQAFEALVFIHAEKVAHRDAFYDNFLVQWRPQSIRAQQIPCSRPRVYLIDFETAICFPEDSVNEDCTCIGHPFGNIDNYARPTIRAVGEGKPYNPFILDVWQLSYHLAFLETSIPELDEVLLGLRARRTASEVLKCLAGAVASLTPEMLHVSPTYRDQVGGRPFYIV